MNNFKITVNNYDCPDYEKGGRCGNSKNRVWARDIKKGEPVWSGKDAEKGPCDSTKCPRLDKNWMGLGAMFFDIDEDVPMGCYFKGGASSKRSGMSGSDDLRKWIHDSPVDPEPPKPEPRISLEFIRQKGRNPINAEKLRECFKRTDGYLDEMIIHDFLFMSESLGCLETAKGFLSDFGALDSVGQINGRSLILEEKPEPPKPRPLIYIAGPYTAKATTSLWPDIPGCLTNQELINMEVDRNIERAMKKKAELMKLGFAVICPHANSARMERTTDIPHEVFLEEGIVILLRCDAVYFLKGYHESKGALKKLGEAQAHGIDCVFEGEADEAEVLRQILEGE